MCVALDRLKPFGRVAGTVLKLHDLEAAFGLIFVERRFHAKVPTG